MQTMPTNIKLKHNDGCKAIHIEDVSAHNAYGVWIMGAIHTPYALIILTNRPSNAHIKHRVGVEQRVSTC